LVKDAGETKVLTNDPVDLIRKIYGYDNSYIRKNRYSSLPGRIEVYSLAMEHATYRALYGDSPELVQLKLKSD
jgi:hypothetical protein